MAISVKTVAVLAEMRAHSFAEECRDQHVAKRRR